MRLRSPVIVLLLAALFAFYLWTAATGWRPIAFSRDPAPAGAHNLLAEAFLAGHLYLTIPPDPRLLALPDPYDPRQNHLYRLHDASLYKDKYYLYWGPSPVLLLFLPFHALTGLYFPENLAGVLFCLTSLLFSAATLLFLQRQFFPTTPSWMLLLAIAAQGLSNAAPFLLRRPAIYEVSLAAAWCFASAAIYFFLRGLLPNPPLPRLVLIGSACLGLAIAARPPFLFVALLPALLCRRSRLLPYLLGPFTVSLILLGLYNYVRFDSPTEFGYQYCLTGNENMRRYQTLAPSRIPHGLYYFFLQPHRLALDFPFWRIVAPPPVSLPDQYYPQPVAGLLSSVPFLNLLFLLPVFSRDLRRRSPLLFLTLAALTIIPLLLALFVSAVAAPAQIYQHYFLGLFLLAATLLWFYLDSRLLRIAFTSLLAYGLLFGIFTSLTGEDNSLALYHPQTWRTIQSPFAPLQRLALLFHRPIYGPLALTLEFPPSPPGTAVPLVTTGTTGAGDILFARYTQPQEIIIGFDHWGYPPIVSQPLPLQPNHPYQLEVHMGSLYPTSTILFPHPTANDRLLVLFDGKEVLRATTPFYAADPQDVHIAANPIGGSTSGPRFPGQVLTARRLVP